MYAQGEAVLLGRKANAAARLNLASLTGRASGVWGAAACRQTAREVADQLLIGAPLIGHIARDVGLQRAAQAEIERSLAAQVTRQTCSPPCARRRPPRPRIYNIYDLFLSFFCPACELAARPGGDIALGQGLGPRKNRRRSGSSART